MQRDALERTWCSRTKVKRLVKLNAVKNKNADDANRIDSMHTIIMTDTTSAENGLHAAEHKRDQKSSKIPRGTEESAGKGTRT